MSFGATHPIRGPHGRQSGFPPDRIGSVRQSDCHPIRPEIFSSGARSGSSARPRCAWRLLRRAPINAMKRRAGSRRSDALLAALRRAAEPASMQASARAHWRSRGTSRVQRRAHRSSRQYGDDPLEFLAQFRRAAGTVRGAPRVDRQPRDEGRHGTSEGASFGVSLELG